MKKVIIPYSPRPLQALLHQRLKRFNVIVCHRRWGKSVFGVNEMIKKALQNKKRNPRYAYLAPTIKQAKRIIWDYIKEYTKSIPGTKYNETELVCTLPNNAKIFLMGSEDPDSIRGIYLDGAILDEVGQMPSSLWTEVVRPTLSDRLGWAMFIGTPKGQNYFYDLYQKALINPKWLTVDYKSSETNIIPQSELDDALHDQGPDVFSQEYECSWLAAIKGAYYSSLISQAEKDNRVRDIPWEPGIPVITAWDLGMNDKTCIWFAQMVAGEIRLIDYYENAGQVLSHYAEVIKSKDYAYEYHILPHDAKQRSISTGLTRVEQLRSLGLKCRVAEKLLIKDGINAVKTILPKCFFDGDKCSAGLVALRNYRSEFNELLGTFSDKPRHDQFSHASDAFRYLATNLRRPMLDKNELFTKVNWNMKKEKISHDPFDF